MQQSTTLFPKFYLTTTHFHQMVEREIFNSDERIELLAGDLVKIPPISSQHASKTKRIVHLLSKVIGETVILSIQDPIDLLPKRKIQIA